MALAVLNCHMCTVTRTLGPANVRRNIRSSLIPKLVAENVSLLHKFVFKNINVKMTEA